MNLLQQEVSINRYLLRLIILGLLIAFIASQVFWAGRLFARLLNFPELRHQAVVQHSSGDNLNLAQLTIANFGFGSAENVLIHVNTRGSRIYECQIDAQELYEIKTLDLEQGIVNIWLDRLASGALVEITIAGEKLSQERIQLSAASDQGASVATEQQTFSDQVEKYAGSTTNLFVEAWNIVINSEAVQKVSEWISTRPYLRDHLEVVRSYEFQTVGLAMLILTLIVGIFFSYKHFIFAAIMSTWFLTWLFFAIEIPLGLLIGIIGLFAIVFLAPIILDIEIDNEWVKILLCLGLFAGLGFLIYWYWYVWVSASWLIGIIIATAVAEIIRRTGILPPLPREEQDS